MEVDQTSMTNMNEEKEKQRRLNPHTLDLLRERGDTLTEEHVIVGVFYSPTELSAKQTRDTLEQNDFTILEYRQTFEHGDAPIWLLEAERQFVPTKLAVDEFTDRCVEIALQSGSEFDGWYTEVMN